MAHQEHRNTKDTSIKSNRLSTGSTFPTTDDPNAVCNTIINYRERYKKEHKKPYHLVRCTLLSLNHKMMSGQVTEIIIDSMFTSTLWAGPRFNRMRVFKYLYIAGAMTTSDSSTSLRQSPLLFFPNTNA